MNASRSALRRSTLAVFLSATAAAAQGPRLHAAIAASEYRDEVPAIAWLCEEYLPSLPTWPRGLDPMGPLSLTLSADGLQISSTAVDVPAGAVAVGVVTAHDDRRSPAVLWRCRRDGCEDWSVAHGYEPPAASLELLRSIGADTLARPRTLAVGVLAGHLAGCTVEGDPRANLLRLCPSLCGDVTWLAWRSEEGLCLRGKSGGGVMLPLVLLMSAAAGGNNDPTSLQLRAFAARDGDRHEAGRQLARDDRDLDVETLRSLLLGDDQLRLTAIRALTRRRAVAELPRIVAAAGQDLPWTTQAVHDAVLALLPAATPDVRRATTAALGDSRAAELRDLQDAVTGAEASEVNAPVAAHLGLRGRAIAMLLCSGFGLLGLWNRARARLRLSAA